MTLLSDQAIRNIKGRRDVIGKLHRFCQEMQKEIEVECYVCKIIGNRWAYAAGPEDTFLPQRKVELTENWGIVIDDRNLDEDEIEETRSFLQKLIADDSKNQN